MKRGCRNATAIELVDLASTGALHSRAGWAIDRVHPSEVGHIAIAAEAASVLDGLGAAYLLPELPSHRDTALRAWWILRHGTPYLMRKGHTFVRPIAEGLRRAS